MKPLTHEELVERLADKITAGVALDKTSDEIARAVLALIYEEMKEPTEDMEDAAAEVFHATIQAQLKQSVAKYGKPAFASSLTVTPVYRAMLSSSPLVKGEG